MKLKVQLKLFCSNSNSREMQIIESLNIKTSAKKIKFRKIVRWK